MNAVVPSQQFQEKLFGKIRSSIGELMTEEDLKKLVEATFQRVFFAPQISTNDYGREISRKPPRIEELVQELVQPSLVTAAKAWLDEPRVIPVTTGTDLAAVLHEAARQLRHPVALNLHSTQGHSEFDQVLTPWPCQSKATSMT